MNTAQPPQPPVMRLIKERRERLGMSIRGAAEQAEPFSEARWRQLENGGRKFRGTWIAETAPVSTLARMALAVRLAPKDIEPFSPPAAEIMMTTIEQRKAENAQHADDAARMVEALNDPDLTARQRAALEAEVAEYLRQIRKLQRSYQQV